MKRSITISTLAAAAMGAAGAAQADAEPRLFRSDAPDAQLHSTGNSSSNSSSNSSGGRRTVIETYEESGGEGRRRARQSYRSRDPYASYERPRRRYQNPYIDPY